MKHILVLTFIAFRFLTCYGQTDTYNIGIQGGFNMCSSRGYSETDNSYNLGNKYIAGLNFQYNVNETISFRTGAYYEQKGAAIKIYPVDSIGVPIGTFHTKENFNFMTIPLLVQAKFGQTINYFINAGPYFSLLLKQTEYIEAMQNIPSRERDLTKSLGKNEFGLSFGLGLSHKLMDKIAFSIEARDNLGLSNLSVVPNANFQQIKTNTLNFLFGISYIL